MENGDAISSSEAVTTVSLWLLSVGASAYLILPSSVLPVIRQDLGIGTAAAGWIISIPYAAEALVSLPLGLAVTRFEGRHTVAVAALALVASSLWGWQAGVAGAYWSLVASRFVGGVAFAILWIVSIDIVTRTVEDGTATAVGVYTTSGPAGLALGIGGAPLLARAVSWPAVFAVAAGAVALSTLVFWVAVPQVRARGPRDSRSVRTVVALVARNENLLLVGAMAFVAYSLFLFFTGWMPTYLSEIFGLSLEESGLSVALFPAVGILARSGGGFLSDYVLNERRRPVVRVSFLVSLPVVVGVAAATDVLLAVALIAAGGFFIQLGIGVFYTLGPEFATDSANSLVVGFLTTAGLLGSFTAPVVAGVLIEHTDTYTAAFGYAVALSVLGILAAWRIQARPSGDREPA